MLATMAAELPKARRGSPLNRVIWLYCISKGRFVKDKNAQNYIREKQHGSIDQGLQNYLNDGYKIVRAVIKSV